MTEIEVPQTLVIKLNSNGEYLAGFDYTAAGQRIIRTSPDMTFAWRYLNEASAKAVATKLGGGEVLPLELPPVDDIDNLLSIIDRPQ